MVFDFLIMKKDSMSICKGWLENIDQFIYPAFSKFNHGIGVKNLKELWTMDVIHVCMIWSEEEKKKGWQERMIGDSVKVKTLHWQ